MNVSLTLDAQMPAFPLRPMPPASAHRPVWRWLARLVCVWVLALTGGLAQAAPVDAGVVRVHFHRPSHDYTGWGLHVWGPHLRLTRDVTWDRPLKPSGVDAYGPYFDVPVDPTGRGFDFIVHRGDVKSFPADQSVVLATHGREVWVLENTGTVFTAPPAVEADFTVGLETEQRRQRGLLLMWGSAAAALTALGLAGWFMLRRVSGARGELARQLAQLVAAQQEISQRGDRPVPGVDDELTGLPTRNGLQQALDQALGRVRRGGGHVAVLFIDLDGFKGVNDTGGHDAGDLVLRTLAGRFKACLRESDMVARVGGDEFVAVVEGLQSPLHAFSIGRKLTAAARLPIDDAGRRHQVGASVGVAVYPADGDDGAALVKAADTAMYEAKKGGKDACRFSRPEMQAQIDRELARLNGLHEALACGELGLDYLPDVDLASGRVVAAEAVLRWPGDGGTPQPLRALFDVAQDPVLAERVNRWLIAEAGRQAQAWRADGLPPLRIGVALMGDAGASLAQSLRQLTGDRALAQGLVLQLPATLLDDRHGRLGVLDALHAAGVGLGVAGLGVQDVSLLRLVETPIDVLTIEVGAFSDSPSAASDALARCLVALGEARAFRTVAAGVDTQAQRDWARRIGCTTASASLAAGCVSADTLTAWRRAGRAPR